MRLAVVTSHPIQYYAPLFRLLSKETDIEVKVFYTWSQTQQGAKYDRDFGKMIEWDIPLLEGYTYEFVNNTAKDPGVHHFNGIINPDLNKSILSWNPDFLLVIGWNFRSHLSSMRFFKGRIPVLFRGDSTLLDEKPGIKKLFRRIFLRWVYSHVDFALYVGKSNKDYFLIHGLSENQLRWVPHAIDNERFTGPNGFDQDAKTWRKELGLLDTDLVVLFAGKLESKKDPGFLLRLAENIRDRSLKVIIVGNGNLEPELKARASSDSRIIFLDFQNQQKMPVVYRLCNIFVLPSVGPGETWGLSVNEAMACKIPAVVSSMCGCAPDLVEENVTGWIFEPGTEGDLKVKKLIEKFLDGSITLNSMKDKLLQKSECYSYEIAIKEIKELLKSLNCRK
jgi:glycosyltransferase involved in cell wall biosynthesis